MYEAIPTMHVTEPPHAQHSNISQTPASMTPQSTTNPILAPSEKASSHFERSHKVLSGPEYAVALAGFTGAERSVQTHGSTSIATSHHDVDAETIRSITKETINENMPHMAEEAVSKAADRSVRKSAEEILPELTRESAEKVAPRVVEDAVAVLVPSAVEKHVTEVTPGFVNQTAAEVVPHFVKEEVAETVPTAVHEAAADIVPKVTKESAEEIVPGIVQNEAAKIVPEMTKQSAEVIAAHRPYAAEQMLPIFIPKSELPPIQFEESKTLRQPEAEKDSLIQGMRRSDEISSSPEEPVLHGQMKNHPRVVAASLHAAVPGPGILAPEVFLEASKKIPYPTPETIANPELIPKKEIERAGSVKETETPPEAEKSAQRPSSGIPSNHNLHNSGTTVNAFDPVPVHQPASGMAVNVKRQAAESVEVPQTPDIAAIIAAEGKVPILHVSEPSAAVSAMPGPAAKPGATIIPGKKKKSRGRIGGPLHKLAKEVRKMVHPP